MNKIKIIAGILALPEIIHIILFHLLAFLGIHLVDENTWWGLNMILGPQVGLIMHGLLQIPLFIGFFILWRKIK